MAATEWEKERMDQAKSAAGGRRVRVEEALERFLDNEELMLRFMLRLPGDPNFPALCQAMAAGGPEAAFQAAHALKGVAGNLAMGELYRLTSQVVEALRGGDLAAAQGLMGSWRPNGPDYQGWRPGRGPVRAGLGRNKTA